MDAKQRSDSEKAAPENGRACPHEADPPLGRALFRVMRAIMFEEPPSPELDALPLAQMRLLWTVFYNPDATMKDFSERLSVSQSTVTQLAERLVRRGLVERKADSSDRRVVRLRLSESGQRILDEANGRQKRTFRLIWDALTLADRETVMHGLELLGQAGEAVRAAQGKPLPALPEHDRPLMSPDSNKVDSQQPVVDLMARRIRGKVTGQ